MEFHFSQSEMMINVVVINKEQGGIHYESID